MKFPALFGSSILVFLAGCNVGWAEEKIFFSSNRAVYPSTANVNIWMMNPNGTGLEQLTFGNVYDSTPRLSPDGRHLAFTRFHSINPDCASTWVLDLVSRTETRLTFINSHTPTWYPVDGSLLAVTFIPRTDCGGPGGSADLRVVTFPGGTLSSLPTSQSGTSRSDPSWYSDGSVIAYTNVRSGSSASLRKLTLSSGLDEDLVVPGDADESGVRYSPDGTKIAHQGFAGDAIYIGDVVAGVVPASSIRVFASGATWRHPSWSADSKRLAFNLVVSKGTQYEIWTADAADTAMATFVRRTTGYLDVEPSWGIVRDPDTTPPVITPTVTGTPGLNGWYTSNVAVTWTISDPESPITLTVGCDPVNLTSDTAGATITCSATSAGGTSTVAVTIKIDKTPPTAQNVLLTPNPAAINTAVALTAALSDTGGSNLASAQYTIDGGAAVAIPGATDSAAQVNATIPSFPTPGVYNICVSARDNPGNQSASECSLLPVYDPNGGFVTGGGWINSPAGAYTPNPSLSGKATFGFVSKYLPGANTPSGDTQFQFKVANLNFKSASYEWLVVAGARAQYKGAGTINGSGSYNFLLTAIDGDLPGGGGADRFRLKIWNSGGVIYDNQQGADDSADPSATLGGGSIVIHKQ